MSVYVFLGPSLPIEQARRELDGAVFLPPYGAATSIGWWPTRGRR